MSLNYHVSLYVPSLVGKAVCKASQRWETERAAKLLSSLAGGCTVIQGRGWWVSNGDHVVEDVDIIKCWCDDLTYDKVLPAVRSLASEIADSLMQECVAIEDNGVMEFVYPPTPEPFEQDAYDVINNR